MLVFGADPGGFTRKEFAYCLFYLQEYDVEDMAQRSCSPFDPAQT